jgi:hypothetical protein
MKTPEHGVGPAFDQARDADEHRRQQQIAALSADQRREYDRRKQDEDKKLDEHRRDLDAQKQKKIEIAKQDRLSGHLESNLNVPVHMRDQARQQRAERLARVGVEAEQKASMERAEKDSRERLGGYLNQAERDRRQQQKQQADKDASLTRAFEKAKARQVVQKQQEHSQSKDNGRGREPEQK